MGRGRKRKTPKADGVGGEDSACLESTVVEKVNSPTSHQPHAMDVINKENVTGLPQKMMHTNVTVRRSDRLKRSVLPTERQEEEPVIENVNLVESEKGEASGCQKIACEINLEEKAAQNRQPETVATAQERNLEQKVDYVIQTVDAIKSKVTRSSNEGPSSELNYRTLYIDSLKMIESLMEKHHELVKELEFTNGQIDAYEKMGGAMPPPKEVILVARLEKDNEDQSGKFESLKESSVLPNADK